MNQATHNVGMRPPSQEATHSCVCMWYWNETTWPTLPADGAGCNTVGLHCGVNEHDSFHQEVGHCKPLIVARSNPGGGGGGWGGGGKIIRLRLCL